MPAPSRPGGSRTRERMGRIFLIVILLGVLAASAAVIGLGAFPPDPKVQQVQKTLPNERFGRTP